MPVGCSLRVSAAILMFAWHLTLVFAIVVDTGAARDGHRSSSSSGSVFKTPEEIRTSNSAAAAGEGVRRVVNVDRVTDEAPINFDMYYGGSVQLDDSASHETDSAAMAMGSLRKIVVGHAAEKAMNAHLMDLAAVIRGANSEEERRAGEVRLASAYCPARSFDTGALLPTESYLYGQGVCTSPACMMKTALALRDVMTPGEFSVTPGYGVWSVYPMDVGNSIDGTERGDDDGQYLARYNGYVAVEYLESYQAPDSKAWHEKLRNMRTPPDFTEGEWRAMWSRRPSVRVVALYSATFMVRNNGLVCVRYEHLITHGASPRY